MRGLYGWSKNIVRKYGWINAIKKLLPKQTKYIYNLGVKFELSDVVSNGSSCQLETLKAVRYL